MRVLFDTNVIVDVLVVRQPFFENSSKLVGFAETNAVHGYVCATTITTISYLVTRAIDRKTAYSSIQKLLALFNVANVNRPVLEGALQSNFTDFEDAVLYQSALTAGVDAIVTRNPKDFRSATLPVYEPADLLAVLVTHDENSAE